MMNGSRMEEKIPFDSSGGKSPESIGSNKRRKKKSSKKKERMERGRRR